MFGWFRRKNDRVIIRDRKAAEKYNRLAGGRPLSSDSVNVPGFDDGPSFTATSAYGAPTYCVSSHSTSSHESSHSSSSFDSGGFSGGGDSGGGGGGGD